MVQEEGIKRALRVHHTTKVGEGQDTHVKGDTVLDTDVTVSLVYVLTDECLNAVVDDGDSEFEGDLGAERL